jgi:antitoxin CptB
MERGVAETDDTRRKRLLFRAQHRGFKEADLVIGGFAAERLASMSEAELEAFEALLAVPDQVLYPIALSQRPPSEDIDGPLLRELIRFAARC